jgi:hypothetical protein
MRHHYSKIFSAGFPSNKSKNAVDIKSTLAYVEKHQGRSANKEENVLRKGCFSLNFREHTKLLQNNKPGCATLGDTVTK